MHRRSTTQPEVALASIYDTGKTNNIPFVASLGNHDGALPHYSRAQVMRYIAADPRSLVTENEIDGSVGNYYLDLVHRGSRAPVARLWFLDARLEPGLPNILDAQLEWLEATAANCRTRRRSPSSTSRCPSTRRHRASRARCANPSAPTSRIGRRSAASARRSAVA